MDKGSEKSPQRLAFFDVLNDRRFREAIQACEEPEPAQDRDVTLRKLAVDFLPPDHMRREISITAVSYDPDFLSQAEETERLVTLHGAKVKGLVSARLGGRDRVFLDIEHHETGEMLGTEGKTSRYLIRPNINDIFSVRSDGEPREEFEKLDADSRISELIDTCRSAIGDEDFAALTNAERMQALQLLVLDTRLMLSPGNHKLKDGLELVCTGAYFVMDGQVLTGAENQLITATDPNQDTLVAGTNAKVFYPELAIYPTRAFDTPEDFTIGHGTPCISVRDESDTGSWWVPLSRLKDFAPLANAA